jgi:cytochrome P450
MPTEPEATFPPSFDALDPYPWFEWMRRNDPVHQDSSGVWYLFGYHDVLTALNPPTRPTPEVPVLFSSIPPKDPSSERNVTGGSIIVADPPRQRAVRQTLNATFSPKVLHDRYASRITVIIDELIDEIIDSREVDIVPLAYSIPVQVIGDMLGVAKSDRPELQQWADQCIGRAEIADSSVIMRSPDLEQYFLRSIDRRRRQSGEGHDDLITTLIRACPHDGVSLEPEELLGNCELLLLAGFETTAHLLANIIRILDSFPNVQQQVWQNPELVPAFIEEALRYFSPVHSQIRYTTREVEIGGKVIPENQMIAPLLASANRDEQVFAHPDVFDLFRFVNAAPIHVAFGLRGTHFCLGAPLARLEATLTMQRLIARIEQIRMVPGTEVQAIPGNFGTVPLVNGIQKFPVTFKRR